MNLVFSLDFGEKFSISRSPYKHFSDGVTQNLYGNPGCEPERESRIDPRTACLQTGRLNNIDFKLVKTKREFVWHNHEETDELFMVIEGTMKIALRDRILDLKDGEMVVIPKGVDHKPVCDTLCTVLLVEPAGTINTGNAGGPLTDTGTEWI